MITKEMSIVEIAQKYPQVGQVFRNFGMGCLGCMAAQYETIEQGAAGHGVDVDALVKALNEAINE